MTIKDVTAKELIQELDKNPKNPKSEIQKAKSYSLMIRVFIVTFLIYLTSIYFQNRDLQSLSEFVMIFLGIMMIFITGGKFFPA